MNNNRTPEFNLAMLCQRYTRGKIGREKYLLKRWEKYNLAAYKIQKAYRAWKIVQILKSKQKMKTIKSQKRTIQLGKSWGNVLENKGTHEEKMTVWRNIVELRRAHRQSSTELCIKALLQSQGELSKAITLLGSSEFGFQSHFGPPLEEEIKEALNPYRKSSTLRDEELENLLRQRPNSASATSSRRAHRHLQQTLQTSAHLTRDEYDLEAIIVQSYYTKGSTNTQDQSKSKGTKLNPVKQPVRARNK